MKWEKPGFYLALHLPDKTKQYQNDIRAQVAAMAFKAESRFGKKSVLPHKTFIKYDKRCEAWALCFVMTSKKKKINRRVIAIINDEYVDITNRFDKVDTDLSVATLTKTRQKNTI